MKWISIILVGIFAIGCGSVRYQRNLKTQLDYCTARRTQLLVHNDSLFMEIEQAQRMNIKLEQEIYNLEYAVDSLTFIIECQPYRFTDKDYKCRRNQRRKDF